VTAARVELLPQARRELEEAFDWYLERSGRAARGFLLEVERALAVVAGAPAVWPVYEHGTRRYLLRRFPYGLIYRQRETTIQVVAVAHHKRRPRYWHDRLPR